MPRVESFDLNAFLADHPGTHRPYLECLDGFTLSVQASHGHYSTPKATNAGPYTAVEVGYPSAPDDLLTPYAEFGGGRNLTEQIYPWTPVVVVEAVVERHGGLRAVRDAPLPSLVRARRAERRRERRRARTSDGNAG